MISVLIVDDEKLVRNVIHKHIDWKAIGVDAVYEAQNGMEALSLLQTITPSIIITDIKMPHMNGIRFAQIIREKYSDVLLVFISGHTNKEYLKEAIHLQADGYIDKPLVLSEIADLISKLVKKYWKNYAKNHPSVSFYYGGNARKELNNNVYSLSKDTLQRFSQSLRMIHETPVLDEVEILCRQIRQCEGTPPSYIRFVYSQLAASVQSVASFCGANNTCVECDKFICEAAHFPHIDMLERELIRIIRVFLDEASTVEHNPINLVNDYIAQNYSDSSTTVEKIATDLNFNKSYLCTLYKQHTGTTINTALTKVRMNEACRLLRFSNDKYYQIAEKIGYKDGKYFTRVFTKEIGLSPREYRRLHHE